MRTKEEINKEQDEIGKLPYELIGTLRLRLIIELLLDIRELLRDKDGLNTMLDEIKNK